MKKKKKKKNNINNIAWKYGVTGLVSVALN